MNLAINVVVRALAFLCLVTALEPAAGGGEPEDTLQFGNLAAKQGLWSEATFRWKRVLRLDPNNGKALNNLAVAYEREGKLEEARQHYELALRATGAAEVRDNYERFRQFVQQRAARKSSEPGSAAASQPQTQAQDPP